VIAFNGTANSIATRDDCRCLVLVRINASSLPVWGFDGHGLTACPDKSAQPGEIRSSPSKFGPRRRTITARLCILALPAEQAAKAQSRTRRTK